MMMLVIREATPILQTFSIYIDAPRILSFSAVVSKNNSMTLTCLAEGLPKPNYTIFSDEVEVICGQHGIVAIPNYNLVDNVTYTCISMNNLGNDTQHVFQNPLKSKYDVFNMLFSIFKY